MQFLAISVCCSIGVADLVDAQSGCSQESRHIQNVLLFLRGACTLMRTWVFQSILMIKTTSC